jgi:tRNA 2-thiocytidine biosynthesis protein TtcA
MGMSRTEHRLLKRVSKASIDFKLIEPGDRIMVAVSGGKDSYGMMHLLRLLQRKAPFDFELIAVNLDQGQPNFPGHLLEGWLKQENHPYRMIAEDTYSVVKANVPEGRTTCSLCSRLRRGILYTTAVEMGCTKIALGHHRDDLIETLLLNVLFSGQLKTMPPRLRSDDGRNVVIRPLVYCKEEDLELLSREQAFPIIPCDLCGSQENLQRKRVKRLIAELAGENEKVPGNIFAALGNVKPSHLLDKALREQVGMDPETGETVEPATGEGMRPLLVDGLVAPIRVGGTEPVSLTIPGTH